MILDKKIGFFINKGSKNQMKIKMVQRCKVYIGFTGLDRLVQDIVDIIFKKIIHLIKACDGTSIKCLRLLNLGK